MNDRILSKAQRGLVARLRRIRGDRTERDRIRAALVVLDDLRAIERHRERRRQRRA